MKTSCVDSRSPEETLRLGARLGEILEAGDVIGLEGALGAGKTQFVQGLARGLGTPAETPVSSPTYTLVGEYPGRVPLRHADFYRIESYRRLEDAGFDDLFDGAGVVVVEWAERFPEALPRERLWIRIEIRGESERRLWTTAEGERPQVLAERLVDSWD
jgi:tRNA threonylcarbamoyladenosine biosynthesis protein TsaE